MAAIQMVDAQLPTTDGRTVILSRYTEPEAGSGAAAPAAQDQLARPTAAQDHNGNGSSDSIITVHSAVPDLAARRPRKSDPFRRDASTASLRNRDSDVAEGSKNEPAPLPRSGFAHRPTPAIRSYPKGSPRSEAASRWVKRHICLVSRKRCTNCPCWTLAPPGPISRCRNARTLCPECLPPRRDP